ncbi:uncharacterized protein [Asterias amurensis]|uniref:uncharacterized protein n=1 Tax=Asterias amurensis TaxID=7602 RepID=UPI003AB85F5D
MNVMNVHLDFPRKRESCVDCGGQVWNIRREMGFFGEETCVDCHEKAGTCPHWLHLYTYLEPHTPMPLSNHGIQRTSLRFHLKHHYPSEIHSDLMVETPWSAETPQSPSATLRSKFEYRCQFAPVWSSTRASLPSKSSRLEGKITPYQIVIQHQLQTTPSVSNLQSDRCQQQQYPHQQLQQEQHREQQQPQQQKHKQQKPQSLQNKLQQLPVNKPTTVSLETPQEAKAPEGNKTEAKSAPATIASIVLASRRSVHAQTQSATAILTQTKGKVSQTGDAAATAAPTSIVPKAVAPAAAAIETGSTGEAAATVAPTASAVTNEVAPAAEETGSTGKAAATVAPTAAAVPKVAVPAAAIATGSTGKAAPTAAVAPKEVAPSIQHKIQSATTTSTATKGKVSQSPPTATGSAGEAAPTAAQEVASVPKAVAPAAVEKAGKIAATAASVLKVVASLGQQQSTTKGKTPRAQASAFSLAPTSCTIATTTSLFSRPPSKVTKTAAPESKSANPVHQPKVETPKPQPSAAALPAGAQAASTTSSQASSASQQQSPKQPKQLLSPVTQALDNYLQGISIPSIELSDLKDGL